MIDILEGTGVIVTKGELGALLRKEGHKNYKECGDKYARNFLKGLAKNTEDRLLSGLIVTPFRTVLEYKCQETLTHSKGGFLCAYCPSVRLFML